MQIPFRLFAGFALLFAIVFAQFPLEGALPGNTDTLLAIALSNQILEKLRLFLSGQFDVPTVMYPSTDILAYGENCFGLAAMISIFQFLGGNEIYGYYLFITFVFALNAVAVTKLAEVFTGEARWASLAGLAFSLAGFTLGNIDDPNVVFVFFPVMALVHLLRGEWRKGFLFSGLQIWFGFYLFAYQAVILFGFVAFEWREFRRKVNGREIVRCLASFLGPVVPLMALYAYNYESAGIVSPYEVFRDCSLNWQDFLQRLPDNLIYPDGDRRWLDWVEIRKNCYPGVVLAGFVGLGLYATSRVKDRLSRRRWIFMSLVFGLFFFLSFGANNPVLASYRQIPFLSLLRVPSRFYLVCLLILAVLFAVGVAFTASRRWFGSSRAKAGLFVVVAAAFIVENVPRPLFGYEYASIIRPSRAYVSFFAKEVKPRVVLDLPSTIVFLPSQGVDTADRLWFFTREILYMNWQPYHRQIVVGGANGYVSKTRVDVENWVRALPDRGAIERLKEFGVSHIVFHKKLVLFPDEDILERLKSTTDLRLALENDGEAIFEIGI